MTGFLNPLYELIFDLSCRIPHDDVRQDVLLQLLLELQKLKLLKQPCKIYGVSTVACEPQSRFIPDSSLTGGMHRLCRRAGICNGQRGELEWERS